jgi:hypothetical protein
VFWLISIESAFRRPRKLAVACLLLPRFPFGPCACVTRCPGVPDRGQQPTLEVFEGRCKLLLLHVVVTEGLAGQALFRRRDHRQRFFGLAELEGQLA